MTSERDRLVKQLDFCKDMLLRIQQGEEPVETPETCMRIYHETKENCKTISAKYRVPELALHASHFEPIDVYFKTPKIKAGVFIALLVLALLFESILLFFTEFLVGQILTGIFFVLVVVYMALNRSAEDEEASRDLSETIERIDECSRIIQNL